MEDAAQDHGLVDALLRWGESNRRDLPWRATRDPWAVLVSEVMLQQTQVDRVVPKYTAFLEKFPTTAVCAAAPAGDVIAAWVGLGYNRRALNLHRAAGVVEQVHDGCFPDSLAGLLDLPGVGPYTARALLAFAWEQPAAPVDTNIGRLLARWDGQSHRPADAQARADQLAPSDQSWAWNQTLMDFGAIRCTRRAPVCAGCPLVSWCSWAGEGPDPADGSAFVGRGQSTFAGSDRQGRGRLVKALSVAAIPEHALAEAMGWPDDAGRARRVLDGLVLDGMVEVVDGEVRLPDVNRELPMLPG